MITLNHISKWVSTGGTRTFLLKDINLSIEKGEFISIMGPSGSGKSTLLNIIGKKFKWRSDYTKAELLIPCKKASQVKDMLSN